MSGCINNILNMYRKLFILWPSVPCALRWDVVLAYCNNTMCPFPYVGYQYFFNIIIFCFTVKNDSFSQCVHLLYPLEMCSVNGSSRGLFESIKVNVPLCAEAIKRLSWKVWSSSSWITLSKDLISWTGFYTRQTEWNTCAVHLYSHKNYAKVRT